VPIAPGYAPNAFVSVLAIRGRVAHVGDNGAHAGDGGRASRDEVTALVDLTRPAYRLGSAQIKVGWAPFRLEVQVKPEHTVYRIREQASVSIHVTAADGRALPAGTEVALAAVDEALLDLAPDSSWDLLQAMMGQRDLRYGPPPRRCRWSASVTMAARRYRTAVAGVANSIARANCSTACCTGSLASHSMRRETPRSGYR
jgi:hypothetical protein